MARKSRETLLRERLSTVSDCPFDIFSTGYEHERLFALIEKAEAQDTKALRAIISDTLVAYLEKRDCALSLLYFIKKGIGLGDTDAALKLITTPSLISRDIPLSNEAAELIRKSGNPAYEDSLRDGMTLIMLAMAVSDEECARILPIPEELSWEKYSAERLYILSRAERSCGGAFSLISDTTVKAAGLTLTYNIIQKENTATAAQREDARAEIEIIKSFIGRYEYTQWTDFWLECLYELCQSYLDGDVGVMADTAIEVIGARAPYRYKELHILAWYSYLISNEASPEKRECLLKSYNSLKECCMFSGIDVVLSEQRCRELIKASVSVCTADEADKKIRAAMRGAEILHTRNRYSLTHKLSGHAKRGRLHIWEQTLSMKTDGSLTEPPKFNTLRVVRVDIDVCRGGVTLPRTKDSCQIFCESEIQIANSMHPIELDLILDISYVSATKCGECEIRVKRYDILDGYLVMECRIVLY